jgi:hypothetical protein
MVFRKKTAGKEADMKTVQGLVAVGILAIVVLAGCFSPVGAGQEEAKGFPAGEVIEPFTVEIPIGGRGERAVAGPSGENIKKKMSGLLNMAQLVVVKEGGGIVFLGEVRQQAADEEGAVLKVENISYGEEYHFLLLMGYWDRTGDTYTAGVAPTLLAAGYASKQITGATTLSITMVPVVVDTEFITGDTDVPAGYRNIPPIRGGKATLVPVDWNVKWTIQNEHNDSGLTRPLLRAQAGLGGSNTALAVRSKKIVKNAGSAGSSVDEVSGGSVGTDGSITGSIKDLTAGVGKIGMEGWVNVNVEYVPFNLSDGWIGYNEISNFDLSGGKVPGWIIRNGINDAGQDGSTDFGNFGGSGKNGNGAVVFGVAAAPAGTGYPAPELTDVSFFGPSSTQTPYIEFKAGGYTTGTADLYYAVTNQGTDAIPPAAWIKYGNAISPNDAIQSMQAVLPGDYATKDYDVSLVLLKGGAVSDTVTVNTKTGGVTVGVTW